MGQRSWRTIVVALGLVVVTGCASTDVVDQVATDETTSSVAVEEGDTTSSMSSTTADVQLAAPADEGNTTGEATPTQTEFREEVAFAVAEQRGGMEANDGGLLVSLDGCVGVASDPNQITGVRFILFGGLDVAVEEHDGAMKLRIGDEEFEYGELVSIGGGYVPRSSIPDDLVAIPPECEAEYLIWADSVTRDR